MPPAPAGYDAGLSHPAGPLQKLRFSRALANGAPVVPAGQRLSKAGLGPRLGLALGRGRNGRRQIRVSRAPDACVRRTLAAGEVARAAHPDPDVSMVQLRSQQGFRDRARDGAIQPVALIEHGRRRQIDLAAANRGTHPPGLARGAPEAVQ